MSNERETVIRLGPTGFDPENRIVVNGHDVTDRVAGVVVESDYGNLTRVTLELSSVHRVEVTRFGDSEPQWLWVGLEDVPDEALMDEVARRQTGDGT